MSVANARGSVNQLNLKSAYHLSREELISRESIRFIDRSEFCQLLVSGHSLTRCDFPSARVRGICDEVTGCCYAIREEDLFRGESIMSS